MENIIKTLAERGSRYGKFTDNAETTQALKAILHQHDGCQDLDDDMREAIEMIFHKISRILCGDPEYADNWVDIAGYAKLVADRLQGVEQ